MPRGSNAGCRLQSGSRQTLIVLALCIVGALALAAPSASEAAPVWRGIAVWPLLEVGAEERQAAVDEVSGLLRGKVLRIDVAWSKAEPEKGGYDHAYLSALADAASYGKSKGLLVLVTVEGTPVWAQDRALWSLPPSSFPAGQPQTFYAPAVDRLDDLRRFAEHLAGVLGNSVFAYECWNEPNLWSHLYPQRTAGDDAFAVRRYAAMLRAFHAGITSVDADARIVAGATSPIGLNDRYRTSPQRFAHELKAMGAAAYFDAYSHHPYTPGGSRNHAPDRPPNDGTTTVTLYNLKQLLRVFPGKPFYLTEYGYNTRPCVGFGGFAVSQVQQAAHLKTAYAYAGRYKQVKMLVWYLVRDLVYGDDPKGMEGVYSGLRNVDGSRKPSWFAFAGGNRVTVAAPHVARRRSWVRVSGKVTNRAVGAVTGRRLQLQARRLSGGSWNTLKATDTGKKGRYTFWIRPTSDRSYRVVWPGVKTSATVKLRVY